MVPFETAERMVQHTLEGYTDLQTVVLDALCELRPQMQLTSAQRDMLLQRCGPGGIVATTGDQGPTEANRHALLERARRYITLHASGLRHAWAGSVEQSAGQPGPRQREGRGYRMQRDGNSIARAGSCTRLRRSARMLCSLVQLERSQSWQKQDSASAGGSCRFAS